MAFQFTAGRFSYRTSAGLPAAGYRLYTYESGTTTQKNAFADSTLGTPCTYVSDGVGGLYIALDSRGEAQVWLGTGAYTFVVKNTSGSTVETTDGVIAPDTAGGVADLEARFADDSDTDNGDAMIAVVAPYTAASSRTQHGKNTDYITGKDFGADGDGDSSSADIQDALTNAAEVNGYGTFKRWVHLVPGYYIHGGTTVTIPSGARLSGEGQVNTQISGAGYASATGAPMFSTTSAPDWYVSDLRLQGENKAAGLLVDTSYMGTVARTMFNAMKGYGIKLIEGAQSLIDQCSFYYYRATSDIGILHEGGSMTQSSNCQFDTRSVGISSSPVAASGVRSNNDIFGAQYPCFRIYNAESLWDIQAPYVEGAPDTASLTASISGTTMTVTAVTGTLYPGMVITGGSTTANTIITSYDTGVGGTGNYTVSISQTRASASLTATQADTDVIDCGNTDGSGGSAATNIIFERGQISSANVNDMTFYKAGTLVLGKNELGVNVTVQSNVAWLLDYGNMFSAGKSLTDNAAESTRISRNRFSMANTSANTEVIHTLDSTLGATVSSLSRDGLSYRPITQDASSYSTRIGGTAVAKIDSSGNSILNLRTSAPALSVNRDMVFSLTSDTNLRISVRGSDGITRTADITLV